MGAVDVGAKMKTPTIISILGLVILFTIIFFMIPGKGTITGNVVQDSTEIETQGFIEESEIIKIPLSKISSTARFYDYGKSKFFIVRASDGSIKTAFDACDICYGAKKGYRQEGNDMICNNCGNYYSIDSLGTKNKAGGGCWPGYLPNSIKEDYIILKKSDLKDGKKRFP